MSDKLQSRRLRRRHERNRAAISPEDQRSLDHVAEVSRNARATWFSLILLLLFCGVTLLGVDDKDFFEYGVSTQLPLVGVSVPTKSFFWAAPLLVIVIF